MTRSNSQELQLGGSGWTDGRSHEGAVQLWNTFLRETAISTLGNFQELASWPQLVGASVGDTHSIKQENGLNDLHRSLWFYGEHNL